MMAVVLSCSRFGPTPCTRPSSWINRGIRSLAEEVYAVSTVNLVVSLSVFEMLGRPFSVGCEFLFMVDPVVGHASFSLARLAIDPQATLVPRTPIEVGCKSFLAAPSAAYL